MPVIKITTAHSDGGGRDHDEGKILEVDQATADRKIRQKYAVLATKEEAKKVQKGGEDLVSRTQSGGTDPTTITNAS